MTKETASRFDALLATYQQLSETCLFNLHVEMRCHVMHYLDVAFSEGNYAVDEGTSEPDQFVVALNSDLIAFEEEISSSLAAREHSFVTKGLSLLIEHLLIADASKIKVLNRAGVAKMHRNIVALQQNLKNFAESPAEASLGRAPRYYDLFKLGSKGLLAKIKEKDASTLGFSYDELKALMSLSYSESIESATQLGRRDSALQARRLLHSELTELEQHWKA